MQGCAGMLSPCSADSTSLANVLSQTAAVWWTMARAPAEDTTENESQQYVNSNSGTQSQSQQLEAGGQVAVKQCETQVINTL